jgi:hypothetical protein
LEDENRLGVSSREELFLESGDSILEFGARSQLHARIPFPALRGTTDRLICGGILTDHLTHRKEKDPALTGCPEFISTRDEH